MGRSHIASEACNCNAPDTGNMEVLTLFGSDEHKEKYLKPLLDGTMASAFAMTEPRVASSDATNIELRMERDGDEYVLNGRKWFASNALHRNCKVLIVMGKTDPTAAPHRQQSMMVVPIDAPGITVIRGLPVFGYQDRVGHAEIDFTDVRVPARDVLKGEGEGFAISQARLGPGQSNLTYLVQDQDGRRWVLRRPPLGRLLASAHDVAREAGILAALEGTAVPTPRVLGLTADPAVTDVPLLLMEFVDGQVVDTMPIAQSLTPERRGAIGMSLPQTLAKIHAVDLEATGLTGLAGHKPYAQRQLKRWPGQWEKSGPASCPPSRTSRDASSPLSRSSAK
jgi:phosphotransferase family enzyme/acyl-CoA dehydrogenase-like protein